MASSTLTIEELTGQKRRVVLKGAGLPFKGASFAGDTVVATTWNNGNPEATQQVLTSREAPSEWQGVWRTPSLLVAPSEYSGPEGTKLIGLAFNLAELFESLRVAGQLLRVTWANEIQRKQASGANGELHTYKKTRLGRLTSFEAPHETLDDIKWSMTFEWVSRGDVTPKSIDFRGEDLIAAMRDAMVKQDAVAKEVAENLLRSLQANGFRNKNYASTFTLGTLEQLEQGVLDSVDSFADAANAVSNRLKALGDIVIKGRAIPFDVAGRALDVANNAVAVVTQFCDDLSQKAPEQQILGSKVSTLLRTAAYFGDVETQAQLMQAANTRLAQQARLRRSRHGSGAQPDVNHPKVGDLLAVHFPRDGETMTSIALRYYQTDLSEQLCAANSLPPQTVRPPRRPIFVPTRSALESRAAQTG